jgi:hypothetical protein
MKTYLEREELELLEQAATNLRDRLLIRLLSHLGSPPARMTRSRLFPEDIPYCLVQ